MNCPKEKLISEYLDERLPKDERQSIERHISKCNHCLDLLVVAYEAQGKKAWCPPLLKERIRVSLGLRPKKKRSELKWLFGALIFFGFSFVFRRFFAQFLVVAAILGIKWAMEGEAARRAIMIFKGIEKKEKKFERKSTPPVSDIAGGDKHGEGR